MRNLLSVFAPVLSGALAVGAIWWMVNRFYTVNGVGLLARQDWPLNDAYLCIAAGAVFGLLRGLYRYAKTRRRAAEMAVVARELGFQLSPVVARPIADDMPLLANWRRGENGMVGQRGGILLEVVDFTGINKSDEGDSVTRHTVVLMPAIGLPNFDLRPRHGQYRFLGWLGLAGVTFDHEAVEDPSDAASVARFGKLFYLSFPPQELSPGQAGTVIPADQESSIRRTFSPAVMEVLSQHPNLCIQSHGDRLALWQGEGHSSASARPRLIESALEVRSVLLHSAAAPVEVIVPARRDAMLEEQQHRANAVVVGVVLGGFAGFVVGAFGSTAVFPNAVGLGTPARMFVAPLVFFGCCLGGIVVGAFVGSYFRLRPLIPATPKKLANSSVALRSSRFVGAGFVLFGGVFAAVGGWSGYSSYHFADGAERTEGAVVTMESGDEGSMLPVVRYRVAGIDHECKGQVSSSPPSYTIGDKVTILYRPEMPADGRIDSFFDRWLVTLVFGGIGLVFAGIGLVQLRLLRRGKQAGP